MDVWSVVDTLKGRELQTLRDKHKFHILAVTGTSVILHLRSTDKDRVVKREEIEQAYQALTRLGQLSRGDIRNLCSERNPAYVAAILAALPNCRYTVDPITIYWTEQ